MKIGIDTVRSILYGAGQLEWDSAALRRIAESYDFLERFASNKIIYGINTGFGPMAKWRVSDDHLRDLQYNIIRSHATGMGEPLSDFFVRASMLARVGSFAQGKSGVHPELVALLTEFINRGIYPYIPKHGSVGASGDLVQLAHMALCLIGEGKVHYRGAWRTTREVMDECGLQPMSIQIREGLSCTNGTSVMTGISAVNQLHAENLLHHATLAAVWMNEIAGSYDDLMAAPLNESRRHEGQIRIAELMRAMSSDSKRLQKRENMLYSVESHGVPTSLHSGVSQKSKAGDYVVLLPGSRRHEIENCLPRMLAGAEQAISTMPDIRRIIVTRAPGIDAEIYDRLCAGHEQVTLTSDTYAAVLGARAAVVNSGTATLETALLDCPETAVYHLKFGRLLGLLRPIMFQIPYFTLVNIITGRQVIRELLMYEFTVESVRDELYRLLTDKEYLAAMRQGYNELLQILGTSPAARTAAALITRGA